MKHILRYGQLSVCIVLNFTLKINIGSNIDIRFESSALFLIGLRPYILPVNTF